MLQNIIFSEVVLQPNLIKNNIINDEVYLKSIVYEGIKSMEVKNPDGSPIPAVALQFGAINDHNEICKLSFVYSIKNAELEDIRALYQFYGATVIDDSYTLSDLNCVANYISYSHLFNTKKNTDYKYFVYCYNNDKIEKVFLLDKHVMLINYIKTHLVNSRNPVRDFNRSIIDIPDDIRNTNIEITQDTKFNIEAIYYEENKEAKTAIYRVLFTISNVDGLFIMDLNGKSTAKKNLKKKIIYTDFDKMFSEVVEDKYEDNTYILDIYHSCNHVYKKSLRATPMEKKMFIFADTNANITFTFTLFKEVFDTIIKYIEDYISENISSTIF